jgi:hypothetical protein
MDVLRRKPVGTEEFTVRVPRALSEQLSEQERRAERMGFDFNATLVGLLADAVQEIDYELTEEELHGGGPIDWDAGGAGRAELRVVSDGRRRRDH